jgi:ferredoxin
MKYLSNVVTLQLDSDACTGCGMCVTVCPHAVFAIHGGKAEMQDRNACMECGACARNCPAEAITVRSGVGCAAGVMLSRLGKKGDCCGGTGCC